VGTFSETAIVDYRYHLSFADQGKQISVSSVIPVYIYRIFIYVYIKTYGIHYAAVLNGKQRLGLFSFITLPFADYAHGSFSFCPFVDKETNGSYCLALCYVCVCGYIGFVYPAMSMMVIGPSLLY
jgi:hypothetical protein